MVLVVFAIYEACWLTAIYNQSISWIFSFLQYFLFEREEMSGQGILSQRANWTVCFVRKYLIWTFQDNDGQGD